MLAKDIPDNSVVKLADGRIGRLDKCWNRGYIVHLPHLSVAGLAVEIKTTAPLTMLQHPGGIVDDYIKTKYCHYPK